MAEPDLCVPLIAPKHGRVVSEPSQDGGWAPPRQLGGEQSVPDRAGPLPLTSGHPPPSLSDGGGALGGALVWQVVSTLHFFYSCYVVYKANVVIVALKWIYFL